jgi:multiple sugar transport system substrate-binding protein
MKKLTFWAFADHGFESPQDLRDVLRDLSREFPDTEVSVEIKPYGALWEALFSALKNPRDYPRPDFVQLSCTWVPTLGHMGLLEDLSSLIPHLKPEGWLAQLRGYCGLPDRPEILALPWWMGIRVLYYRKDLFKSAGLDAEELLSTWEGFTEACRFLQKKGDRGDSFHPVANPNPKESVSLVDLAPHIWTFGGQLFSADGRRALFHREEAFHGTAAYLALLAENWMPLLGRSGLIRRNLFEGHAALQFSGRYPREVLLGPGSGRGRGLGARIGAVPFPAGPARAQTIIASRQLAVVRGSKYPREAAQCVFHLTKPAVAEAYARAVGGLPCTREAFEDWFQGRDDIRQVFVRSMSLARPLPAVSALGVSERVIDRAMESVVETVLRGAYKPAFLREQLIYAAAEVDYILSLYE